MPPVDRRLVATVTVFAVVAIARAAPPHKTFVSLSGTTDDHPRLGNPVIRVEIAAASPEIVDGLSRSLITDLGTRVHSRPERGDAAFDYRLSVRLVLPSSSAAQEPVRFEASLEHPDRGIVWRTDGYTEVGSDPVDADVLEAISRNLVSALVHDRWVVWKDDPDDPPPAAPTALKSFP